MNDLLPIQVRSFPKFFHTSFLPVKSYLFFACNILTVGIYGWKKNTAKKRRINDLKSVQTRLLTEAQHLQRKWLTLEKEVTSVWEKIQNGNDDAEAMGYTSRLKESSQQKFSFNSMPIVHSPPVRFNLKEFFHQFFWHILTMGCYGTIQNYILKNQIRVLKMQNLHIGEQLEQQNRDKLSKFQIQIATIEKVLVLNKDKKQLIGQLIPPVCKNPRKYAQGPDDGEILGAFDWDNNYDSFSSFYAIEYKARYDGKLSAAEIVRAGLEYAFTTLHDMSKRGTKVKITDSMLTPASDGSYAVYNFMILDWIKGGTLKRKAIACETDFELVINKHVSMHRAFPEKVLKYEKRAFGDGFELRVDTHFHKSDDFTPAAEGLPFGVDAISAKWIYARLSEEERKHLFNLLIWQIIEDDNVEYQNTVKFMESKKDPRVQLVQTAYDLIWDLNAAIQKKFNGLLIEAWKGIAQDKTKDPFIKEKVHENTNRNDILDQTPTQRSQLEWGELDENVLSAHYTQPEFFALMSVSQLRLKTVFKFLPDIMLHRFNKQKFKNINWDLINLHFDTSHEMVGVKTDGHGGARCLFSNLLAVLVTDKKDLTLKNVLKLLKAMAAYLDKLQVAKREWESCENDNTSGIASSELKNLSQQAVHFEQAIKNTYHCSLQEYQKWLRQEEDRPHINANELTPLEIELCANTLGIKIGLLAINIEINGTRVQCPAKTNAYGSLIPCGEFYGPNTKEYLLMLNLANETYFGLMPILKDIDPSKCTPDELEDLNKVKDYWSAIAANKPGAQK